MAPKPKETPTLDNTTDSQGAKLKDVLKSSKYKDDIFGVWPTSYEKVRSDLIVIDHPSFSGHKWFQDFAALSKDERTAKAFLHEVEEFIRRRKQLFFIQPETANNAKMAIGQFVKWVQETDRKDKCYAMDNAKTMVKMVQWIHEHVHKVKRKDKNKHKARYDHIREHVGWWNRGMEVQGWYPFESHKRKKTNDVVRLSDDADFALYRTELHTKANEFLKNANKTSETARNKTKRMSEDDADMLVETFNNLQAYGPRVTQASRMSALTHYAILAINHNLGFRGGQVRGFCYSWFLYEEVKRVVRGVFLNMGNPRGHKVRSAMNWGSSQFIVRHIDVRQCPVGAIIKTIVARHDILGDTSLLDQIEDSIETREAFVEAGYPNTPPHAPRWHGYKLIRSTAKTNDAVSQQLYGNVITNAMRHIGIAKLEAAGHEPRNRVSNNMLEMGVSDDLVARFMGWSTGKETLFDKVYGLAKKHTVCALARAGYPGFKNKEVDCPREGDDEDLEGFESLRNLVLGGRVSGLLKRAKQVNAKLQSASYDECCDRAAEYFLELLDKFLIRVWLEDAAILQPRYPKSVCYEGHKVFVHPEWREFVDHLATLRKARGEDEPLSPAPSSEHSLALNESGEEVQPISPKSFELLKLIRQNHTDATITTLYVWRKKLDTQWKVMRTENRGIPKKRWEGHMDNRSLYSCLARMTRYIDNVGEQNKHKIKETIDHLQHMADTLGLKESRNFAEEHFRLMAIGPESEEARRLLKPGDREKFQAALNVAGLPWPSKELTEQ
jgi:hypothetical protein